MADVPHFDLPFRFGQGGHATTVEQDSEADVINCVAAIVRTTKGSREDLPDFGIDDPTFSPIPINTGSILEDVFEQEPRAHILAEQAPDAFNNLEQVVRLNISVKEDSSV
jgi:hypothetical protein